MTAALPDFSQQIDIDSVETREWLDALAAVIEHEGPERAHFILERMVEQARRSGAYIPFSANTDYINTIPPHLEDRSPGDAALEERIRSFCRWNALAMVARANMGDGDLGGHIASFASVGALFGIGFNHFWRAPSAEHGGDLIYFQGHSAPGIYARAFLEGRLTESQLENFRREVDGVGISSYPHPWLMPDFWQFPTVSMGLGPIQSIYQARFLKYLHARGLADTEQRKVWVFCGDGEMDEPESLGAIGMASREKLDNLIFVVNCNLQRLDGPVRGNGKIIQELEADFRGAGWNVIKVIWGSYWDPLFARDKDGALRQIMMDTVDGEYQNYKANDGAFVRKHFFGKDPQTLDLVSRMTDDDIWRLNRGGHDPHKIYAAYSAAVKHKGQPTVILAKTIKGYGLGKQGQAKNPTHQLKKLDIETIREFRDRFNIPIPDDKLAALPFYKPAADDPVMQYLHERRKALGGYLPARRREAARRLPAPPLTSFQQVLQPTAEGREISTTMAFVRILTALIRDKEIGKKIVPIVPDEARTFGMEGMFRQLGIYSAEGQKYDPVDRDQVMYYREDKAGQILEEGINEAGAFSSWMAAATSYSNNGVNMIPFYIFYSMFGFQRIGDLAWAAGDLRSRGFLLGATAGRTTLNGEGLQHEDGHSHILSAVVPNCVSYDPTFAYELAVIIQHGLVRMLERQEDVFYYITVMNENYVHPGMPEGIEADIIKGMYLLKEGGKGKTRAQLMGSGTILREVMAAGELLESDWKIAADIWSCPSFTELRRDGLDCDRWNMLHPDGELRVPHVTQCLSGRAGAVVAATDYMKAFADGVRPFMPREKSYRVLGTDGFGRSDTRAKLREHFEVNRHYVVVAALKALAEQGEIKPTLVAQAIKNYGIDPDKRNPAYA
ncbi:MAG: pyruvate dehydrogenase (acetyl-transferring), homodimeric type [Burkholderiales bacterium]